MELLQEELEEIQEKILNLLIFDELISKVDRNKILNYIIVDYFTGLNKEIAKAIMKLRKSNKEINTINVIEAISDNSNLLIQAQIIKNTCAQIVQIEYYIKALNRNYLKKLIIESKTPEDYQKIEEIKNLINIETDNIKKISDDVDNWEEKYNKSKENEIQTLFKGLDDIIGSFAGGDYVALGGGTGQGKTLFALNLAVNVLFQNKKVLYCSLEMPLEQLQNRLVCLFAGINANKIRQHNLSLIEIQKYKETLKGFKELNLDVVTDYKLTVDKLENYIARSKPNFVIIDYLGLMSANNEKSSLYEKVTNLSRQIKILATSYNIPILVLVQLNRELKNRDNKRPKLSDIRESGAIEQDSDFVLFTHRQYAYDTSANKNEIEILIAKNRHGEAFKTIPLKLNLETQKVSDYDF